MNFTIAPQQKPQKFCCNLCDFNVSNKKDYNRHLVTRKHINNSNLNILEQNQNTKNHVCKFCKKTYASRNGLWYHVQKCKPQSETETSNTLVSSQPNELVENKSIEVMKEMMNEMFQNNTEMLKNILLEITKEPKIVNNITNNNTQTNTQNNSFNLQVFLNEKCKDAITANQFANNIEVSMSDLQNVGNKGLEQDTSKVYHR